MLGGDCGGDRVSGKVNANGHRRREVVRRTKAEEPNCALCDMPIDPTLRWPDPECGVVDEKIPRSRGGSQYHRSNTCHMHNRCNRWKGTLTLEQARAKLRGTTVKPVPAVGTSQAW